MSNNQKLKNMNLQLEGEMTKFLKIMQIKVSIQTGDKMKGTPAKKFKFQMKTEQGLSVGDFQPKPWKYEKYHPTYMIISDI